MASDPGTSNILSLSGRSTLTDFSSKGVAAGAARGMDAALSKMTNGKRLRDIVILHQAADTFTDSATLRMKPAGFQFGVAGCATPLLLVQRTRRLYSPGAGSVNCVCHCRKLYLPSSLPSFVERQLWPRSIE